MNPRHSPLGLGDWPEAKPTVSPGNRDYRLTDVHGRVVKELLA